MAAYVTGNTTVLNAEELHHSAGRHQRSTRHTSSMNQVFTEEDPMPTFDRPRTHADEAREALRQFAHATRRIEDPTEIYPVLGELSNGLASLAQSLHQIGEFHEGPARKRAWVTGDARAGRAASSQVAAELHRAAEMVRQVAAGIDRAHEVEATIAYHVHDLPALAPPKRPSHDPGLSL